MKASVSKTKYPPLAVSLALSLTLPSLAAAHPGPDGAVESHHNEVETRPKGEGEWQPASVGQEIFPQGRVATREASTASVSMRDASVVSLREHTLLIIYGHHAARSKRIIRMDATLETGALRSRLGELSGGQSLRISTPSSDTEQEGGVTLVKVDEVGTSRVHNHGDGRVLVKGKKAGRVKLEKAHGSKVEKGKRPARAKPLPPTPVWQAGPSRFLGVSGHIGTIFGSWDPVEGASNYFVEVARDAEGDEVMAAVLVPASIQRFEVRGLPPGKYFVRVSSVDDDQFESLPSVSRESRIIDTPVANAQGATLRWVDDGEGNESPIFVGAGVVSLPEGIECEFEEGKAGASGEVSVAAKTAPRCVDSEGNEVIGFPLDVESPRVGLVEAAHISTIRGKESRHLMRLAEGEHGVEHLLPVLPPGFELASFKRLDDGSFELVVRAEEAAADQAVVEVRLGGGEGPVLAELTIVAADPEAPAPAIESKKERHMFELGVGGFASWFAADHGLFDPDSGQVPFDNPVAGGVLGVGYFPLRWAGLELNGRLGAARGEGGGGRYWALRGQLVGQLPYRITPTLQLGFDAFGVNTAAEFIGADADVGFHWGLGGKAFITRRIAAVLGLNHLVYEAEGAGQTHHLELNAGLRVVFGRHSAGRKKR
jgi:hypothetical protein